MAKEIRLTQERKRLVADIIASALRQISSIDEDDKNIRNAILSQYVVWTVNSFWDSFEGDSRYIRQNWLHIVLEHLAKRIDEDEFTLIFGVKDRRAPE